MYPQIILNRYLSRYARQLNNFQIGQIYEIFTLAILFGKDFLVAKHFYKEKNATK